MVRESLKTANWQLAQSRVSDAESRNSWETPASDPAREPTTIADATSKFWNELECGRRVNPGPTSHEVIIYAGGRSVPVMTAGSRFSLVDASRMLTAGLNRRNCSFWKPSVQGRPCWLWCKRGGIGNDRQISRLVPVEL